MSLIETEYALADAHLDVGEISAESHRETALRKASIAIRIALLALSASEAREIFSSMDALH
jgi:hypothetical protein